MKTIGMIGGMSWESSLEYYRILNETVRDRLGGLHSAQCVMVSVDFAEIEALQHNGRWKEAGEILAEAARVLERAGAACVVLCTNTMHKLAGSIQAAVAIPLLHIADATGQRVQSRGLRKVGLLGTRFKMEEDFYKERLVEHFGLEVLIPPLDERQLVHDVIYQELCLGILRSESKGGYSKVISGLAARGAQGIILGCTEISLLVKPEDSPLPLFDTTRIHAEAAVDWALAAVNPEGT
jgi:aspartate racemase